MNPSKNKELKKLTKLWYKKLEKEGFQEIEQADGNLKVWHSHKFLRTSDGSVFSAPAKEEYFRSAGHFLHDHVFSNEAEKDIWKLHCEGLSIREIAKVFKSKKNEKEYTKCINNRNVHLTLQSLARIMLNRYKRIPSPEKI